MAIPLLTAFASINTFVFDIDGVLTDGSLWVFDNGEMTRQMNIKDGYALQLAVQKGYKIAVISGGNSQAVKMRLEKLGISDVYLGVHNKLKQLVEWAENEDVDLNRTLYMGDDIPDLECMKNVGLACCPHDAAQEIKNIAAYLSPFGGGKGCVRDVIEKVLKLQHQWQEA